jgi:hypothetical protein
MRQRDSFRVKFPANPAFAMEALLTNSDVFDEAQLRHFPGCRQEFSAQRVLFWPAFLVSGNGGMVLP